MKRLLPIAVGLLAATVLFGAAGGSLLFPRLNDTYRDLAPAIAPVSMAGMTIELSSPSNSLTIKSHRLELEALGDGVHHFRGAIDFLGKAKLIARFGETMPGEIQDEVLLPTQTVELEGEITIVRDDGGYDLTTVRLPEHAEIAMQSRLASQLLTVCDLMTVLAGGDCSGLERAFGRVRLPLPPPGRTYRVEAEELTAEERAMIDDYLAG